MLTDHFRLTWRTLQPLAPDLVQTEQYIDFPAKSAVPGKHSCATGAFRSTVLRLEAVNTCTSHRRSARFCAV